MVNTWIKFTYIALETVSIFSYISHCLSASGMDALAFDAGIGIMVEHGLPERDQHVHQGVLNNAIRREGQDINRPLLRLIDSFSLVSAGMESFVQQDLPDMGKIAFNVLFKVQDAAHGGFAFPGAPKG